MSTSAPISVGSFLGLDGEGGVVLAAEGTRGVEDASTSMESVGAAAAEGGEGGRSASKEAWVASSGEEKARRWVSEGFHV